MKKLIMLLTLTLSLQVVMAHQGGHGHQSKATINRNWHFVDQTIAATGSFLLAKDGKVFIETDQKIVSFELDQLLWTDQKYVERQLAHIHQLNSYRTKEDHPKSVQKSNESFARFWTLFIPLTIVFLIMMRIYSVRANKATVSSALTVILLLSAAACGSDDTDPTPDTTGALVSATSDPEILNEAFAPYSTVSTRWDDTYFYVESNGIPEHQMMVGITAWIAQVPIPQPYTGSNAWSIPLNTKYAENPISIEGQFQRGAIGIAANGIPIFNPINASGLISNEIGELDAFGGHSGRGDDYHYHTAPTHLESTSGSKPIAYALDGYAVYGSTEPDGSAMLDLDDYHGHEYTDGTYHYHGTDTYPYMIAAMRGEVTLEGEAPQSQVTPQPQADPPRGGDPHPINGDNLIITDLVANGNGMGYVLSYTIGGVAGSVDYSWDANDLYTFIFHDVDGTTTTETFQR